MKHIEVVAAIITKDNKILCTQRPDKGEVAKKWEFPGGKIESGETHEQAIKREVKEELGCNISVDEFFMTIEHQYKFFQLVMHCYKCTLVSQKIILHEHIDSSWMTINNLDTLDWAPADWPIINIIMSEGI